MNFCKFCFMVAGAGITLGQLPAYGTLVSVATPGNLLARLPTADLAASSSNTGFGAGIAQTVDNSVNTSNQDNGLIFTDADTDQRFAITGFNSVIRDIRFFSSPSDPGRFPSTLTVYYSTSSKTSLNSTDYTLLTAIATLNGAAFTAVPGSTAAYLDLFVNAPIGTQSLLFDLGTASAEGDRISEVQAFTTVSEPSSLKLIGLCVLLLALPGIGKGAPAKPAALEPTAS